MGINKLSLGSVQWGSSYGISNVYGQTNVNEVSKILNEDGVYLKKLDVKYIENTIRKRWGIL